MWSDLDLEFWKGKREGSWPGDLCEQPPTEVSGALVGWEDDTLLLTQRSLSWLLCSLTGGALGDPPVREESSFPLGLV